MAISGSSYRPAGPSCNFARSAIFDGANYVVYFSVAATGWPTKMQVG